MIFFFQQNPRIWFSGPYQQYRNTIAFVAGKSGGHIIPALTLAQQIVQKDTKLGILFFTTTHSLDQTIIANNSLTLKHVILPINNIPYKQPWLLPLFFLQFIISFIQSYRYLRRCKTKKVISIGGLVSLPVCFAATIMRIPIELYELNAVPGKAIKRLSPLATTIYLCFEEAKQYLPKKKCIVTSYPIRYPTPIMPIKNPHKKNLLIVGGSQGSLFINRLIKQWVEHRLILENIHIIHQTGTYDTTDWNSYYKTHNISADVFTFKDDLSSYYKKTDIMVCRAGAGTLFEALFFNIPLITIPLRTKTTSHQIDNAQALQKKYPSLITILEQNAIEKEPAIFFTALNVYVPLPICNPIRPPQTT